MGKWCPPVMLDTTSSSGFSYEVCALESAFLSGSSNSEGNTPALLVDAYKQQPRGIRTLGWQNIWVIIYPYLGVLINCSGTVRLVRARYPYNENFNMSSPSWVVEVLSVIFLSPFVQFLRQKPSRSIAHLAPTIGSVTAETTGTKRTSLATSPENSRSKGIPFVVLN